MRNISKFKLSNDAEIYLLAPEDYTETKEMVQGLKSQLGKPATDTYPAEGIYALIANLQAQIDELKKNNYNQPDDGDDNSSYDGQNP